jgi:hypothetical protein
MKPYVLLFVVANAHFIAMLSAVTSALCVWDAKVDLILQDRVGLAYVGGRVAVSAILCGLAVWCGFEKGKRMSVLVGAEFLAFIAAGWFLRIEHVLMAGMTLLAVIYVGWAQRKPA